MAGNRELLTLDLPGHGSSANVVATLDETADLIARAVPDETFDLGGYSFGGRVALHLALAHPDRVRRLVLVSATRGIVDDSERTARRERDERLAEHAETVGAEQFLQEWLDQPLFSTLPQDTSERGVRSRDAAGLASSLRHSGTGTQRWLGNDLAKLTMPVLVITGGLDAKFTAEGSALARAVPHGTHQCVDDSGHAVHLERPNEVARLVTTFLDAD